MIHFAPDDFLSLTPALLSDPAHGQSTQTLSSCLWAGWVSVIKADAAKPQLGSTGHAELFTQVRRPASRGVFVCFLFLIRISQILLIIILILSLFISSDRHK